jgi:hypothetical protein
LVTTIVDLDWRLVHCHARQSRQMVGDDTQSRRRNKATFQG